MSKERFSTPQVTVVIDGQYGSCGKGAICGYLADEYDVAVRVGAPNAGHTLKMGKNEWKLRQIPVAGLVNTDMTLCIGAAGLINLDILRQEMKSFKGLSERFFIDRNAGILEEHHIKQEEEEKMFQGIGSTCEGVGAALRHKIKRDKTFKTAKDVAELRDYIINVSTYLNNLPSDKKIMIEGTQGYGLSLNHGDYPYCTSRDIIASSLLSDVGLAPSLCNEVIMVIRTYPIRVFGNSGPMCGKELTWKQVQKRSGYKTELIEKTTVTKRVRRVCEFDMDLVIEATKVNRPTQIALTFADYISYDDHGIHKYDSLSKKTKKFIDKLEDTIHVPVTLIKTGNDFKHICDRRSSIFGRDKGIFDEGLFQ